MSYTISNAHPSRNHPDLQKLISCLDLTDLNDSYHDDQQHGEIQIEKLCHKASTPYGNVAAVCIYPQFVNFVRKTLIKNPIKIATVVNFPKANDSLEKITQDIQQAILDGASEIDAVMPHDDLGEFVQHCKSLCGDKIILKIILETGGLNDDQIKQKSNIAIQHGADFLKTSTGKVPIGATPNAAKIMLNCIKMSGKPIGFKASGGVRTVQDALIYVTLVREILGESAFSPRYFRIGASQLLDEILRLHSSNARFLAFPTVG